MSKAQRILFFVIGLILGLVALRHILADRSAKKAAADMRYERSNIPGMLREYALAGAPIYGRGVIDAKVGPAAEGFAQTRRVLTGGMTRYDENGRKLPEEFIAVTEYYSGAEPLTEMTPVKRYEFSFADRVRVTVREPGDTAKVFAAVKATGAHLYPEAGSGTAVLVRHAKPALDFVPSVLATLKADPAVVSAEPVKLDWVKEATR